MKNSPNLAETVREEIRGLAFKQIEQLSGIVDQLLCLVQRSEDEHDLGRLLKVLEWFTNAHSLRPVDFKNAAAYIARQLNEGKPLPVQITAGLENLGILPPKPVRKHVATVEKEVENGNYDRYVTAYGRAKYETAVNAMIKDGTAQKDTDAYRDRNPEYCAAKKIRRRPLRKERNFNPEDIKFEETPEGLSKFDFECLCYKHVLLGLEDYGKTPLLLKLSVNPTPHGIMIFIPRYWSLDPFRDINWKEICKLLRLWGIMRQGEKMSGMRLDRKTKSKILAAAYEEAGTDGSTGEERKQYALKKAGFRSNMSDRAFYRALKEGKELCAKEAAAKKKV